MKKLDNFSILPKVKYFLFQFSFENKTKEFWEITCPFPTRSYSNINYMYIYYLYWLDKTLLDLY